MCIWDFPQDVRSLAITKLGTKENCKNQSKFDFFELNPLSLVQHVCMYIEYVHSSPGWILVLNFVSRDLSLLLLRLLLLQSRSSAAVFNLSFASRNPGSIMSKFNVTP